jgi:hypothetical protein
VQTKILPLQEAVNRFLETPLEVVDSEDDEKI